MGNNFNIFSKFVFVVVRFVNVFSRQHCRSVVKHCIGFCNCYCLLRQEIISRKSKPAAVYCNLNIIRAGNLARLAVCIFRVFVKLKTQTVVKRLCGKFTGCRLVRLKRLAGIQVNYTKFNRKQNITVAGHIRCYVGKIVIRHSRVVLNRHIKCVHQLCNPFASCYCCFRKCVYFKHRAYRKQHRQNQNKT